MMRLQLGQTLGRYRITAVLGAGGMGEVYRAHDSRLDRDIAIKLLKPDFGEMGDTASLMDEARAVSALSHAHVCTLHEVDDVDGHAFLVMELVEGRTLASVIESGPVPVDRATHFASQIASALVHAHKRGVVHCDLKTANVMVTPEDSVKVLDFGIARRVTTALVEETTRSMVMLDAPGAIAGTLGYMAPERLSGGRPDERGDIWALGVVVFEMLTGRRPFEGATAIEVVSAIARAPVPELPQHVPSGLRAIVRRCLAKEPERRYQHAREVSSALDAVIQAPAPILPTRWRELVLGGGLAVALATAGLVTVTTRGCASDAPTVASLAVLPFADLTPRPESEYLAAGVTDAVITELGQVSALRVTSHTSSMRYRNSDKPISTIAQELGVEAVLEGSLFRDAGRLRVTARLVRADTESTLWTGTYEREVQDVLALQRDLAQTVTRELRLTLTPAQASRLGRDQRANPEAVEAYLKGRYQWAKRTPAALLSSIALFEQAVKADPAYAAPYAGLANAHVLLSLSGIAERSSQESIEAARVAAARALELDPRSSEALTALAYAQLWSWDLAESERTFGRAIELNPSDATTRFWHAVRLSAERRFDEAIAEATRAQRLDPVSPIVAAGVSWAYHLAGRHQEAEDYAHRVLSLEPDFAVGLARLGVAQKHRREYGRAADTLERVVALSGRNPDYLAQLGQTYGLAGRADDARRVMDELNALSRSRYVPDFDRALVAAGLGDREGAFAWLERAFAERYSLLALLRVEPDLDAIRADPRFERLARRIDLAPTR